MTTQNELNQAKALSKRTSRLKRLNILRSYNLFRFKKEKITYENLKLNEDRLKNKFSSLFVDAVCASDFPDSKKIELTKNHKSSLVESDNLDLPCVKFYGFVEDINCIPIGEYRIIDIESKETFWLVVRNNKYRRFVVYEQNRDSPYIYNTFNEFKINHMDSYIKGVEQ